MMATLLQRVRDYRRPERPHVHIRISRAWLGEQDPDFRFTSAITDLISREFGVTTCVELHDNLTQWRSAEPQNFSVDHSTDTTVESEIIDLIYSLNGAK